MSIGGDHDEARPASRHGTALGGLAGAARPFVGAAARRLPARVIAAAVKAPFGPSFGSFECDDGRQLELLGAYRDFVKSTWRVFWWPSKILFGLRARVELPAELLALAASIDSARTLPVPYGELGAAVGPLPETYPEDVLVLDERLDARLATRVCELVPSDADVGATATVYRATAEHVARRAHRHGLAVEGARVLDVGTGSGYLAFALSGAGAEVTAVDLDLSAYVFPTERERVRALLERSEPRARLVEGDVHDLPFEDGSFDLVISMTAVEHFTDPARAFAEMARVLRPGGLTYHTVDPWFGVRGGHSLCTLDVPWGHVRLAEDELERYLRERRPHEAEDAVGFLRTGFQVPRLTLRELRSAVTGAGFEVIEWQETPLPAANPHRALATGSVLRECRRIHPSVTRQDLLTLACTIVARR